MTDTKRTRNTKSPLPVGEAFDKIRARLATQPEREQAHAKQFLLDEAEWLGKVAARVPEDQRASLAVMLNAVGAPTKGFAPFATDTKADPDPDAIPARLREPLSEARIAVGRGR